MYNNVNEKKVFTPLSYTIMHLLFLWSFIGNITLKNCQQPILTDALLEQTFNGNVTATLSSALLSCFLGFSFSRRRQL